MTTKTKVINGVKITITKPRSNYIALVIVATFAIGSFIAAFLAPAIFQDLFGALTIAFTLLLVVWGKAILSDPF